MKERLHYVDVCKGLLILMVIWQHIPAFVSWAGVDSSVIESCGGGSSWLFWGFYMQAFFLTNGYTSNFKKDFRPFLWGSFKALLIPYIAFALIGKGLDALFWGETQLWQKFGYFYQLYRFGKVASRTHAIPYLIKVLGHFFVKCLLVNLIDTRTALVFLHLVVSFPHQSLVYYKRFCLVHCFILNFLSWTLNLAKHATPFAPSPLQKLQHYYEVVRHRHGHQYFLPCVSRLSAFSLSIPCLFLLFLQRAHVKFMPSLHRTPSRQ